MTINLKIEVLKVFAFEFNFSSDKKKKDEDIEKKEPTNKPAITKQPSN